MVEKYRGILPNRSIWYRLNRDEARALIKFKPDIEAQLPKDKPLSQLDSIDIQALPGGIKDIEDLLTAAGLKVITLFD